MVQSLLSSSSGMMSQQKNIDVIANNLSNVNTTGFKKSRAEFKDLMYQYQVLSSGSVDERHTLEPVSSAIGTGSMPSSIQKLFSQGILKNTGVNSDVAIKGEGFFRVLLPNGVYAYTRDGSFRIDKNFELVTKEGYRFNPPVVFGEDMILNSMSIADDGVVTYKSVSNRGESVFAGDIILYQFINPAGLESIGENLYVESLSSGSPKEGIPSFQGYGSLNSGFLELSNVNIADELVSMIVAQRAYELSSRSIQTSDRMLETAVNLRR